VNTLSFVSVFHEGKAQGPRLFPAYIRMLSSAEAIYSYEGTREMNTLIVGKAITGFSAFV
jgi:hypothetical protein